MTEDELRSTLARLTGRGEDSRTVQAFMEVARTFASDTYAQGFSDGGSRGVVMTPGTVAPVPNTPGTPRRTIRIEDGLWAAAVAKAAEKGESVSDVLRRALIRYVRRP